jgi:hypothetical protein
MMTIYQKTKAQIPRPSVLLGVTFHPKAKENFCMSANYLFYIL